jgi:hypothetical protein
VRDGDMHANAVAFSSVKSCSLGRKSHAPYRGSNGRWWVHSYHWWLEAILLTYIHYTQFTFLSTEAVMRPHKFLIQNAIFYLFSKILQKIKSSKETDPHKNSFVSALVPMA